MNKIFLIILFFYFGTWSNRSFAETYSLYYISTWGKLKTVNGYNKIVNKLKPDDELKFTDGEIIKIGALLGGDNNSKIFELAGDEHKVIRIPNDSGSFGLDTIGSTQLGHKVLLEHKIPCVKIFTPESREYVIVERLGKNIKKFDDIVSGNVSILERQQMLDGLIEFAKLTYPFTAIGDFLPEQMVYDFDQKSWILFDWDNSHRRSKKPISTVFDGDFFSEFIVRNKDRVYISRNPENEWILLLYQRLNQEIETERLKHTYDHIPKAKSRRKTRPSCLDYIRKLM